MNNIYDNLNTLGMLDEEMTEDLFNEKCSYLVDTFNLVDDLMTFNDSETIKKLLVILLYKGK